MTLQQIEIAVLKKFCRPVTAPDFTMKSVHYDEADALSHTDVFANFAAAIHGADVLDFGCGFGYQTLALAKLGARTATGVEIEPGQLASAIARGAATDLPVKFSATLDGTYDVIYSQNSFEHFMDPDQICADLRDHLRPGGKLYITFAPPWFAPYGAHMSFFTQLPWVHLFFREPVIMAVRSQYRNDPARSYTECGLGKMTIKRFEQTIQRSALRMDFCRYDCIRGLNFLAHLPLLRELFINRVSCILTRP